MTKIVDRVQLKEKDGKARLGVIEWQDRDFVKLCLEDGRSSVFLRCEIW